MKDDEIITGDEVTFHDKTDIVLPRNITYGRAKDILQRMQDEAETMMEKKRTYQFRPFDGAVAAQRVMKRMFGITIGMPTPGGFFSPPEPPETRTVQISATETLEVPWGRVYVPSLGDGGVIMVSGTRDREHGMIAYISVITAKKNSPKAVEFLDAIGQELKTNSIYRGQAIVGTEEPEFLNLSSVKPEEIVFSDEVMSTLEGTLWSVIRHREVLKSEGVRIKRALLLEGPYGTGKTSAGQLTALEAVASGWTFIASRPGDNINEVLKTAKLYQPAVVFIEDVDNQASTGDSDEVSKLLESFDGVTSKGSELALLMTTNHFERIHKGMLRPGRIDAVVEVAALDRNGTERLVRAVVAPNRLADDVDYDKVYEAMTINVNGEAVGFYPAFVREALERAKTYAIGRLGGGVDYKLDTSDLVGAAISLHNQLRAQYEADEGETGFSIDDQIQDVIRETLNSTKVKDLNDDDSYYRLHADV
ncbi:AAA family ATPase [Mycobacteroides abscessus]|uniref:AAA family ATPase n=1 Tax=Mycobacteroides abscessus TaxID=36809 RepID=UPI0009284C95|nr:ATP-binding protein [Mycobacteroides abscessus]DAZ90381.1 TPA_asm: AAA-ATPase [Mycobacterium phage prophiFSQJ01-1]SII42017.1 cell division protease ftsH-like protein [Mycobacteroides abscessus subsp. abscessus]SIK13020.1 cell division protease ftsH-like protein [Mycobacteroides abscessus subsp. abscessus]SIN26083.1 cell division protease ftsH-like protein [Mycobacteroides abscessus subsp. abscessus]SLI50858.1 cell division protease ftsH-like protein [Mycobacteroides abscessus subsp. abscess